MTGMRPGELEAARIGTVRDHMRLECERDWDAVIASFAHPAGPDGDDLVGLVGERRAGMGDKVVAPTGRGFRVRMMASFEFAPGSAKILCERPYFDQGAVVRALGLASVIQDPTGVRDEGYRAAV
jgi:hypothetical protein